MPGFAILSMDFTEKEESMFLPHVYSYVYRCTRKKGYLILCRKCPGGLRRLGYIKLAILMCYRGKGIRCMTMTFASFCPTR